MKRLFLIAGNESATYQLAPLYRALTKHGAYHVQVVLAATEGTVALSPIVAECFGIGEDVHTIALPKSAIVEQLAFVMQRIAALLTAEQPDLVVVCGCDNTALGATLTATKLGVAVAAVDAGLRNYDRSDSDEQNRMLIDTLAQFHFVSEHSGEYNLINEGYADEASFFGNNSVYAKTSRRVSKGFCF